MNKRERMLLIAIVVVGGVVLMAKAVYPKVVKPIFDLSDQILAKQEEKMRLDQSLFAYDADVAKYRAYVLRTGGTDAEAVQAALNEQMNNLLKKLKKGRVSPKKPTTDRKTKLQTVSFGVNAEGTWANVLKFIQQFYELPYVAQFTDIKLSPTGGRRRAVDNVKISGTIDVCVLPAEKSVGKVEVPEDAVDAVRVKYSLARADVSRLLTWQPFKELKEPTPKKEKETTTPVVKPSEKAKRPGGPKLDPLRAQKVISQIWSFGRDEIQVRNVQNKQSEWLTLGDKLDSGKIVLVHPLGVVVRRPAGTHYVYLLGKRLSECITLAEAVGYPEIQFAAKTQGLLGDDETSDKAEDVGTTGLPADVGTTGPPVDVGTTGIAGDLDTNGVEDEIGTNGISGDVGTNGIVDDEALSLGAAEEADTSGLPEPADTNGVAVPDASDRPPAVEQPTTQPVDGRVGRKPLGLRHRRVRERE